MATINYKEEVLKVYPDAKMNFYYDGKRGWYILTVENVEIDSIDSSVDNAEKQLIENIYNKLKNQKQ